MAMLTVHCPRIVAFSLWCGYQWLYTITNICNVNYFFMKCIHMDTTFSILVIASAFWLSKRVLYCKYPANVKLQLLNWVYD